MTWVDLHLGAAAWGESYASRVVGYGFGWGWRWLRRPSAPPPLLGSAMIVTASDLEGAVVEYG